MSRVANATKAPLRLVAPAGREGLDAPDDEALILAVQRGDRQVASALYDRLIRVVDHTVYRVFGRREVDHDDLVQMVFEQIIVTLSRRSYARACNLRTWASSIASHVAFNALRSRRRERKVLDREAPPDSETYAARGDAEREAAVRSDLQLVRATLVDMKPQYAETVFLHDVLGHELAEIALMMRVSVAAAQSRLVRGRKDLHKRLALATPERAGGDAMTRKPLDSEPEELLRLLAAEQVPSEAEDSSPARRDRLVRSMKDALERTAEQTEKSRRFRRVAYALSAAAGFALLGGLLLEQRLHGPVSIAGIDAVHGTVVLTQDGARHVIGSRERSVHDGDALQTAAGARARLVTAKSSVSIAESTELRLSQPSAAEERISLRRGRVDVAVDKAVETKRAVVVETPDAEVVVRGTAFDVRVEPSSGKTTTFVHVTRGSVWVLAQGVQVALLGAGQTWSSAGGVAAAAEPAPVAATSIAPVEPAAPAAASPKLTTTSSRNSGARKPGTLTEENRLFAAGVEARNRGDAGRAAELFGELLAQYPQTALRESAQVERFRSLSRAGLTARAASEARRYLAEHSDGFARSEARDLALDK